MNPSRLSYFLLPRSKLNAPTSLFIAKTTKMSHFTVQQDKRTEHNENGSVWRHLAC